MNRRIAGQNLSEFVILIAVVTLACILAYTLLGKQINQLFTSSQKKASVYEPFKFDSDSNTGAKNIAAGELGGTRTSPKPFCQDGLCAIDYGDFVLNGIPENYGEFIETDGTSGGTDNLSDLLAQIGEQIKDTDNSDGNSSEDFKLIANLGHFAASIQKAGEKAAAECSSEADPTACFNTKDKNFKPTDIALPDNLASILTRWPTPAKSTGYSVDSYKGILNKIDLGWAASGNASYPDLYPSIQIMKAYNRIKAADESDGVTPQMQQIATALIKQIDSLNDNLQNTHFKVQNSPGQWQNWDPIEKNYSWNRGAGTGDITEIYKPKTSKNTNIRSNIFCATGHGSIIGATCK